MPISTPSRPLSALAEGARRRDGPARRLAIIGAGGHATSCADVAASAGYEDFVFVDPRKAGGRVLGFPVVARAEEVRDASGEADVFIAIGDNFRRSLVAAEMRAALTGARFPALIHCAAFVSPFSTVEEGTVIMAGAVIGAKSKVGRFCIVNTCASLDHDGRMADFSSLAPGAVCGGAVTVGERSAISIGAVIRHGVSIGADTVVGGQSYVHHDLPGDAVAFGSPAKVQRTRKPGDAYL